MANILWMDNDRTFLMPFISRLEGAGHKVVQAFTIQEAEQYLSFPHNKLGQGNTWHFVLIDIMMPIKQDQTVSSRYSAEITDKGKRAGVVFFSYNRNRIIELNAVPAFLSMRKDSNVQKDLIALGVPPANIKYKMDVSDTRDFLNWVDTLLA
jgi:CheY-like chemotaxis protein